MSRKALIFESIARSRSNVRSFINKPVSSRVLKRVLELSMLAPTSFNLQPFRIIVVVNSLTKDALASAMLGGNADVVKSAFASVVFLADKDPLNNAKDLIDLELANGSDPTYVSSLPAKFSFLLGKGFVSTSIRQIATHLLSPLQPTPVVESNQLAWSMKNASLIAQQFLLACTAYNIETAPMEGFDERRVINQLSIPNSRYSVPMIISIGYTAKPRTKTENENSDQRDEDDDTDILAEPIDLQANGLLEKYRKKVRFPLERQCFEESFGQPLRWLLQ